MWNVVLARAQCGELDADDVEAIKQILAKIACSHGFFERAIRGSDDAHIGRHGRIAAHALKGTALEDAQNFRLCGGGHVADFIEEQRAAVALLKLADALGVGAGERAFFVPEEFALQQMLRNRGAVDGEKGPIATLAVAVNGARDELLPRAAFAGDERSGIAGGELADGFENLLHREAFADNAEIIIFFLEQWFVGHHFFHRARGVESIGDELLQLGHVERFEHIIVRTMLHRGDGGLGRAKCGH